MLASSKGPFQERRGRPGRRGATRGHAETKDSDPIVPQCQWHRDASLSLSVHTLSGWPAGLAAALVPVARVCFQVVTRPILLVTCQWNLGLHPDGRPRPPPL